MGKISSRPASQTPGGACRAGQFSLWETSRVAAWLSHRQPILDANFGCGFRQAAEMVIPWSGPRKHSELRRLGSTEAAV